MRTIEDKKNVLRLYDRIFGESYPSYQSVGRYQITAEEIKVGHAVIYRNHDGDKVSNLYVIQFCVVLLVLGRVTEFLLKF